MNIRKTPFRVAQVFALLLLAAVPAISQSQRVIYTTDNPPTVCAPGKIYTNATTHKTYQATAIPPVRASMQAQRVEAVRRRP
nr:hypothetical protein [uncultured bacterium]